MASIGHWYIDLRQGQLYWSDEVYRIHGVTREDYTPDVDSAIDFYHPDDAARVSSLVDKAISEGRGFDFEFRLVRRDGSMRVVRSRALVQIDESDVVVSVTGIIQDITAERETEPSPLEHDARFELAMLGASVGLWEWDLATDDLNISEHGARIAGLTQTIKGEAFLQSIIVQDQKPVRDALAAHYRHKGPFDVECRMCAGNREVKWVRLSGQALWDDHDVAQRMAGSLQDISESKRHEALREAIGVLGAVEGRTCADRVRHLLALGHQFLDLDLSFVVVADDHTAVIRYADAQECGVDEGDAVSADPASVLDAAGRADFLTDRDEIMRLMLRCDAAGPHAGRDMIGYPVRIAHRPRALLVFAGRAQNGRIFGQTARSMVKVLAAAVGYEMTAEEVCR